MRQRILMVDDERDLVFAVRLFLESYGYEFLAAYDGREALALLETVDPLPDLVILDVYMPRMSGWDVLRMMRASERTQALQVIMLTAADEEVDVARGHLLGVDWYQTKPFKNEDLLLIIQRILATRGELPESPVP